MSECKTIEIHAETQAAIDGDRDAARDMLAAVARGEFNADTRLWLETVAARILAADDEPNEKRRPGAIVAALGLRGKRRPHRARRELLDALDGLSDTELPADADPAAQHRRDAELLRAHALGMPTRKEHENAELMRLARAFRKERQGK